MAKKIAEENKALLLPIQCICPDDVVKKWLEERLKKKSISDGRWEIYQKQKETFEPFVSEEDHIKVDTSEEPYEYRMNFFRTLLKMIHEA